MNVNGNFPTYEQQQQALNLLQELGIDVDALVAYLGTPNSSASSAGGANAHAKLNELLSMLAIVDNLSDDLITRIGTPVSASSNTTSSNAHAKLNWLLSTLAMVNTNTATANLGTPSSTASNATSAAAHAKLNYLLANMPTGILKSVQRGFGQISNYNWNAENFTISTINSNKAFALVHANGNDAVRNVVLTSNTMSLTAPYGPFSYQIIEFY